MVRLVSFVVAGLLATAPVVRAQSFEPTSDDQSSLSSSQHEELESAGLENLSERISHDGRTFFFEYRLARNPAAAVCRLLAVTRMSMPGQSITVVLEHARVPTVALHFEPNSGLSRTDTCPGYELARSSYDVGSTYVGFDGPDDPPLLDLVVGPHYGIRWGSRWDPVEIHAVIAPRAELRPWPGMELSAEVLLPVWNEWVGETGHIRPGRITASQIIRAPGPTFARLAVGKFTAGRVGADVQIRRPVAAGRLTFGIGAGHTAGVTFPQGSLRLDTSTRSVLLASVTGYTPRYDLFVHIAGGQFLYGDLGGSVSIVRRFGGLDVGLNAALTDNGRNVGFHLVLPLLRGLAWGHNTLRVRPEPMLPIRYEYSRERLVGERYKAGTDLDEVLQQHHPLFLPHMLDGEWR